MPIPKIKAAGAADFMKVDDGTDSLDTFIRQAIGKEPYVSFSRANDSPVQWIQLLNALDQQDLPGWPFLAPLMVQMQKCDKCSREFCSAINYRRHIRLHRRNLNIDKDSTSKNRTLLQAFWDKLSSKEAMEIMSLNDVSLEGVSGTLIVKALNSFIRKSGFTSLPQSYVKFGVALLDIVQGRPSRFPITSQELFSILDGASERTFLYAGTAESLQKYVFDGEAGKIGLEMKNLIACTSFLVEQKLVKACLAEKDAEALRYHKLLMEEEEAAQKRQAAILEKRRLKKLRQKEQRSKEEVTAERYDSPEDTSSSPTSSPGDTDSVLEVPEVLHNFTTSERVQIINVEAYNDTRRDNGYAHLDSSQGDNPDLGSFQNVEYRTLHRSGRRSGVNSRWNTPKVQGTPNGFCTNQNYQALKSRNMQKHASSMNYRPTSTNGAKVWTPKPKSDTDEESCKTRLQSEAINIPGQERKHEVLIGSISVTLQNCSNLQHGGNFGLGLESSALEINEKVVETEVNQSTANRSTVKLWRPVSRHGNGGQLPVQNDISACEDFSVPCNDNNEVSGDSEVGSVPCNDNNEVRQAIEVDTSSNCLEENTVSKENGLQGGSSKFSSYMAEVFLAKRWKEAIASDHMKLVLFPESRPPDCLEVHINQEEVPSLKQGQRDILRSAENRLESYTSLQDSAATKSKTIVNKLDKGNKVNTSQNKAVINRNSGYS